MNGHRLALVRVSAALLLVSCSPESTEPTHIVGFDGASMHVRWSEWASPVNVGEPVNSARVEQGPAISRDGLVLIFQCGNCPGGFGATDLWVSRRANIDAPWGTPRNLGPAINTAAAEGGASLSIDGHHLFFHSSRDGGFGGTDIYMARRRDANDDLGWQPPVNLGAGVNTDAAENAAQPFETADGRRAILFVSPRSSGLGGFDIYMSVEERDGVFGHTTMVEELSTAFNDQGPAISRDGLELIFPSDRTGTFGQLDLWRSTRRSLEDTWSVPENLGPEINSAFIEAGPELSFDGRTLYFHAANRSDNVGGPFFDLWYAQRMTERGKELRFPE